MATVQIDLPDQLAQEAEIAGLLAPSCIEELLRQQLRCRAAQELSEAITRMDKFDDSARMSPEEVAEEIAATRRERRAAQKL